MPVQPKFRVPKTKIAEVPGLTYRSPHPFRFKQRLLLLAIPPVVAACIKALMATCRFEVRGGGHFETAYKTAGHVIVATWHDVFGLGVSEYSHSGAHTLTSYSYDGEIATLVLKRFGILALRGSSTIGGSDALRDMTEALKYVPIVGFTPDGPRGPRRIAKAGVAILSARSQVPIVPYALMPSRAWRLNSWDRFQIAKPFARIITAYGPPIPPPHDCSEKEIEDTRQAVEKALNDLQATLENETRATA